MQPGSFDYTSSNNDYRPMMNATGPTPVQMLSRFTMTGKPTVFQRRGSNQSSVRGLTHQSSREIIDRVLDPARDQAFVNNLKDFAETMFQNGRYQTGRRSLVPRFVPRRESQPADDETIRHHLYFLTNQRLRENPQLLEHIKC